MKHILIILSFLLMSCLNTDSKRTDADTVAEENKDSLTERVQDKDAKPQIKIEITKDVPIRSYFKWMDSVVETHNQIHNYSIDEYIIVHNNKWIIDTLANTDYYYLMDKGIFSEDPQALIALKEGQVLNIPDSLHAQHLKAQLNDTSLELNIPEYRLRIIQGRKELYKFPVRVGKTGKKYMAMAKREVDMKTIPGIGEIIRVNKNPTYMNPVNNNKYKMTNRDDGKRTGLPAIPWLEPAINGRSVGQLIHPTTNMGTLGKASSNGCIGLRESDAWRVYYYAPMGTRVVIKYELEGENEEGEKVRFKDIYPGFDKIKLKEVPLDTDLKNKDSIAIPVCDCGVVS